MGKADLIDFAASLGQHRACLQGDRRQMRLQPVEMIAGQ
jgi:hypothetical protein